MGKSILDRILNAYSRNEGRENPSPMWDYCVRESKKLNLTIENLENMGNNELVTGFFWDRQPEDHVALLRLAEAIGVRGIQNPEGAVNPEPKCNEKKIFADDLFRMIKKAVGIDFKMPEFDGNKDNMLHIGENEYLYSRYCYYLLLLKRILDQFPDRRTSIVEIGAGIGLLGYFLDSCGYKDYTIIDLARINAIQAYFLHKNLPERQIVLSGELEHPFLKQYSDTIRILHVSDYAEVPIGRYDLMVNMDGLTEMNIEDAKGYLNSDCACHVLSVNHEQNDFRVIEIYDPELRILKYRYPFHARAGYVEEMYDLKI